MSDAPSYAKATAELGGEPTHYYAPFLANGGSGRIGYICRKLVNLKQHELDYIQAVEDLKDCGENRLISNTSPELKAINQIFIEKDLAQ